MIPAKMSTGTELHLAIALPKLVQTSCRLEVVEMRPCLRVLFSLSVAVGLCQIHQGAVALGQQAAPFIDRVELTGKRLVVTGSNFDAGSVIEVNGREVATKRGSDTPAETLIAKKGGKRLGSDASSFVTVRNSDNQVSRPFFVFRTDDFLAAYIIALNTPQANVNFHAASLSLKPGDYFVVDFAGITNISLTHADDPTLMLELLLQAPFESNTKYLYHVKHAGNAFLNFTQVFSAPGDVPPFVLMVNIEVK